MKKLNTLVGAFVMFAFAQTTISQTNEQPSADPVCGTEAAMAKMPAQLKSLMEASAVASQADELMLYINFNPNGSTVRPGFGNADTLTSGIINGQRTLPPPQLSQAQKDEIVRRVSDEFSPFNIRVTTDAAEFFAYPRQFKQMCLITTTPSAAGFPSDKGGVSPWAGIGLRLPGDFAFVFSSQYGDDPLSVAAVVTHESAHLLGLGHQHLFSDTCGGLLNEYHPGFGSGSLSFDPLMGEAIGDGINNWFSQSCPDPTYGIPQNDYDLINSQVVVRPDDFPDELGGGVVEDTDITGILERAGDVDLIKINFGNPGPVFITSDNIDLKVSLLNPGGKTIGVFNDPTGTGVVIPSANGMRYLKIEAAGNENMAAQFMTGKYRITY